MSLDDPLTITVIGAVVIIAVVVCAVVIFGMRRQQERKLPKLKPTKERQLNFDLPLSPSSSSSSPFRVSKSN
jgi:hypothetical protein